MPTPGSGPRGFVVTICTAGLLLIGVLWLQAALAGLTSAGWTVPPGAGGLTQSYTTALAKGQAHLEQAPDPRLLALPNPYDPAQNAGYRILDLSLYAGRYYLYFGIVPWACLLVPWFKLTGTHLSDAAAIWIFCSVGFCAYALALFKIWRRWFPLTSALAWGAAASIPAIASGAWVLLALPQMTQVPSAAAYAFFALAWLGVVAAETNPAHRIRWSVVAMFGAAALMGCRPNYAPAVALLALWSAGRVWRHTPAARLRATLCVVLPLLVVGALLAAWNHTRFGNPLEFGFRYQLANVNRGAGEGDMAVRHILFNLHRYVFGGARLTDYFPFIAGESPGPFALPAGHDPSDQVYGVLWIAPAFAALLLGLARAPRTPLRPLVALLVGSSLVILLLLAAFGGGAYRYPVDFMPPLALAAGIGVLLIAASPPGALRFGALVTTGVLTVASAASGLFQTVALYDGFQRDRPQAFAALARPFNALVYLRERLQGTGPRALRLQLTFPKNRNSLVEPLVVVGTPSLQDFLYVYYAAPDKIQLGFEAIGRGGPVSRPLPLDYSRPHILEIRYGSFLPPDDHALVRGISGADLQLARRVLTVLLDGETVLDGWADFHAPAGLIYLGTSPDNPAFGERFTGVMRVLEGPPLPAFASPTRWSPAHYGPLRVDITLRQAPISAREPLLSLGHRNQGALIVLERLPGEQVRLGYFPSGGAEIWGPPFVWPRDRPVSTYFDGGAFLPPPSSALWPASTDVAQKKTLQIRVDEKIVFSESTPPLDVSPGTIIFARNDLLITGIAPSLAAEIGAALRLPLNGLTTQAALSARSSESVRKTADRTSTHQ